MTVVAVENDSRCAEGVQCVRAGEAFVVLRQGDAPSVKALQDFVKAEIAPFKYPRSITFIDALPKTQTGKIQRFRLREDHS